MNKDLKDITHKHTAAGFIPKDWDVNNLDRIAEFRNGKAHENIVDSQGKYIIINSKYISTEGEIAKYSKEVLCPLFKDEIVMVMSDIPNGKAIAKCFYVDENNLYTLNQRICAITAKKVDSLFLYYALNRNKYYLTFDDGVNQTNLRKEEVLECPIPLPPLPEQKAIAKVLSTADAAIHATEKLITQKELRKKWLMQQLLTGKKRLKGFEGEWKEYPFEKLLKVVKRPVKWDDRELYKLISVRRRSGGIFFREALYGHQIKVKDLRDAAAGDFLFSKMQIVHGASALVTKEFEGAKISGSYVATVAKEPKLLNMEYFNWYSQLPYFYHQALISSYGVHIEKMTFDFETFLQLEMTLPSFEEQTAIAQVLQAADKEISLLKAKAEKLREQKKGLMQQLLTGRVRLKIK